MEFSVGTHIMIELMDERKIAGYLIGGSLEEGGLFLSATHKESEMTYGVSDEASDDIVRQLREHKGWKLRVAGVLSGHPLAALGSRDELIGVLHDDVVAKLVENADDGLRMRELANPVVTFVNAGAVLMIENTLDRAIESDVRKFDQDSGKSSELEKVLDEILVKDLNDKEEDNGEGTDVQPEGLDDTGGKAID